MHIIRLTYSCFSICRRPGPASWRGSATSSKEKLSSLVTRSSEAWRVRITSPYFKKEALRKEIIYDIFGGHYAELRLG
jgi:hypothetical protein